MTPEPRVLIHVNGEPVAARRRDPLLEAMREAGVEVPSLCHYPTLTPAGACRLCLVEVSVGGKPPRLTTACNYPVQDGLEVTTDTPWVQRTRQGVLELLLAQAPGSEELRDLAARYGVITDAPRTRDGERCIRCGLCIRTCSEVVGAEALGWTGRGDSRRVGTPFDDWPQSCIGCGACAAVCPTNAIQMEAQAAERFARRFGPERRCRYAIIGVTPGAPCANGYQCWRCEVEHSIADALRYHPVFLRTAGWPRGGGFPGQVRIP